MWTASHALFEQNRDHAEDLVCDLICDIVAGRLPRLPTARSQVVAFAKGVLRNRAKHVNRDEAVMVSSSEGWTSMPTVDPWLRDPALWERLRVALSKLTPRERQVAMLHWVEHHTIPVIAYQLKIAPRTVKEILRRARRKLFRDLADLR